MSSQFISSRPVRWGYLLQESLLILAFSFLFILNGTNNDFLNLNLVLISACVLTALAVYWAVTGKKAPSPLSTPLLIWCGVYAVTVATSIDLRRSMTQMLVMLAGIFLFTFISDLIARGWPKELVVKSFLIVGAILVLMGWLEAINWYRNWLQAAPGSWLPSASYRPNSANIIAMVMNLILMTALARMLSGGNRLTRTLLGSLAAGSAGLIFLTSSRAGWLGSAAGIACLAFLHFRGRWEKFYARLRKLPGGVSLPVIGAALGLAALTAAGWYLYQQTLLQPTHGPISTSRTNFWVPAWQTFLTHPLSGQGQFTFATSFLRFNSIPPYVLFIHSHGTFFNLLAEMGLAGLAAAMFLVFHMVKSLAGRIKEAGSNEKTVIFGTAAALIATAVHSIFDCFHADPVGLWMLGTLLACSLSTSHKGQADTRRPIWPIVFAALVWIEIWMAAPLFHSVESANANDFQGARTALESAVQRDPYSTINWQQTGLVDAKLASNGDLINMKAAIKAFQKVVDLEPTWAMNHANLGALLLTAGDVDEAIKEFSISVDKAPLCRVCYLNLGLASERKGNLTIADAAYSKVLALDPRGAGAYFWRETDFRRTVAAAWLKSQPDRPNKTRLELERAVAFNPNEAFPYIQLAENSLNNGDPGKAQVLLAQARLMFFKEPEHRQQLRWVEAELAAARGNFQEASQVGKEAVDAFMEQGLLGPGSKRALYYAPLLFRKPAMWMELAPQLTLIQLPDEWGDHLVQVGDWLVKSGDTDAAEKVYKEVIQYIPDNEAAAMRLSR